MKNRQIRRPQLLVYRFPPRLSLPVREMRPSPIALMSFGPCYTAEKHAFMDAHELVLRHCFCLSICRGGLYRQGFRATATNLASAVLLGAITHKRRKQITAQSKAILPGRVC